MENKINFKSGIIKVQKQLHENSLQKSSLNIINDMIFKLGEKIIRTAVRLGKFGNKKTIGHQEIKIASILLIPGELGKHALSEGNKYILKDNWKKLQFKLGKSRKLIELNILKNNLIGQRGIIYLSAVLEYIAAEIIELGGRAARDNNFIQIKPRHVMLAIRNDEELNKLLKGYILGSGVFPNINDALCNNRQKGGKIMKKVQQDGKVLQKNKTNIKDPAFRKLLYKAGVKYTSKSVYEESRKSLQDILENILRIVFQHVNYEGRKTVMYKDGIEALKILNISIFNSRGYPGKLFSCKGSDKIKDLPKTKIRRKPSNNLLRLIRKYQNTHCTLLPHAPIKRLIKQIGQDIGDVKYETDFIWLLQAVCEEYLISLYRSSLLITLHCERKTLTPKDILLVQEIRSEM